MLGSLFDPAQRRARKYEGQCERLLFLCEAECQAALRRGRDPTPYRFLMGLGHSLAYFRAFCLRAAVDFQPPAASRDVALRHIVAELHGEKEVEAKLRTAAEFMDAGIQALKEKRITQAARGVWAGYTAANAAHRIGVSRNDAFVYATYVLGQYDLTGKRPGQTEAELDAVLRQHMANAG